MPLKLCLWIIGSLVGLIFVVVVSCLLLPPVVALPVILLLSISYIWMFSAFAHYRQGRQEELVRLLTTAIESGVPLGPALRAYLADRPHGPDREAWVAILFFFIFPGYYWFWHRRNSFDYKVSVVADLLEDGASLEEALEAVPGVVSPDTLLAVGVGEYTGRLALSLYKSSRKADEPFWMEILPRLLYPLVLLIFIGGITAFLLIYIMPKYKAIFRDFGIPFPEETQRIIDVADWVPGYIWSMAIPTTLASIIGFLLLCCSSTFCWYCPGLGLFYRMAMRSRVLKMLSVMLDAGLPAPTGVEELAHAGYFRGLLCRRLKKVVQDLDQGEPLAETLYRRGFLSRAMVSLVKASERIHNLPWVLSELGDNLAQRMVRRLLRLSQLFAPISVLAVGVLVGAIVLGMFMPLIRIIARLS